MLTSFGYRVLPATTAAEAMVQLLRERVDLVIADLAPTTSEHVALLARIRGLFPHIARVAIIDPQQAPALVEAVNLGGVRAVLPIPWDVELLLDVVCEAMGGPAKLGFVDRGIGC
jgi:DNA-binding NtrC family response regulator